MAAGTGAGEVRIRLTLDASDLRTQIDTASKTLSGGQGIALPAHLAGNLKQGLDKEIGDLGSTLNPVVLKASLDTQGSIKKINTDIGKMMNTTGGGAGVALETIRIPVAFDFDKEGMQLLKSAAGVTDKRDTGGAPAAGKPRAARASAVKTTPDVQPPPLREPRKRRQKTVQEELAPEPIEPEPAVVKTLKKKLEKRRLGGAVNANQPYLVGEDGPEMFVPHGSGGRIIPKPQVPYWHKQGFVSRGDRARQNIRYPRGASWSSPISYDMDLPGAWSEYRSAPPPGKDWQRPYPTRLEGARARLGAPGMPNDAVRPWLPEDHDYAERKMASGGRFPLNDRLMSSRVQKLMDEGRVAEAQELQKKLEQMRGGWGIRKLADGGVPQAHRPVERDASGRPMLQKLCQCGYCKARVNAAMEGRIEEFNARYKEPTWVRPGGLRKLHRGGPASYGHRHNIGQGPYVNPDTGKIIGRNTKGAEQTLDGWWQRYVDDEPVGVRDGSFWMGPRGTKWEPTIVRTEEEAEEWAKEGARRTVYDKETLDLVPQRPFMARVIPRTGRASDPKIDPGVADPEYQGLYHDISEKEETARITGALPLSPEELRELLPTTSARTISDTAKGIRLGDIFSVAVRDSERDALDNALSAMGLGPRGWDAPPTRFMEPGPYVSRRRGLSRAAYEETLSYAAKIVPPLSQEQASYQPVDTKTVPYGPGMGWHGDFYEDPETVLARDAKARGLVEKYRFRDKDQRELAYNAIYSTLREQDIMAPIEARLAAKRAEERRYDSPPSIRRGTIPGSGEWFQEHSITPTRRQQRALEYGRLAKLHSITSDGDPVHPRPYLPTPVATLMYPELGLDPLGEVGPAGMTRLRDRYPVFMGDRLRNIPLKTRTREMQEEYLSGDSSDVVGGPQDKFGPGRKLTFTEQMYVPERVYDENRRVWRDAVDERGRPVLRRRREVMEENWIHAFRERESEERSRLQGRAIQDEGSWQAAQAMQRWIEAGGFQQPWKPGSASGLHVPFPRNALNQAFPATGDMMLARMLATDAGELTTKQASRLKSILLHVNRRQVSQAGGNQAGTGFMPISEQQRASVDELTAALAQSTDIYTDLYAELGKEGAEEFLANMELSGQATELLSSRRMGRTRTPKMLRERGQVRNPRVDPFWGKLRFDPRESMLLDTYEKHRELLTNDELAEVRELQHLSVEQRVGRALKLPGYEPQQARPSGYQPSAVQPLDLNLIGGGALMADSLRMAMFYAGDQEVARTEINALQNTIADLVSELKEIDRSIPEGQVAWERKNDRLKMVRADLRELQEVSSGVKRKGRSRVSGGIIGAADGLVAARQLAPYHAAGILPDLASHPDAILVGERGPEKLIGAADGTTVGRYGPEVIVPGRPGVVLPNHFGGDMRTIPGLHAGGGIPHRSHRNDPSFGPIWYDPAAGMWKYQSNGAIVAPKGGLPAARAGLPPPPTPTPPPPTPTPPPPGPGPRPPKISTKSTRTEMVQARQAGLETIGNFTEQLADLRSGISEQLSLTPVRALSVSIGQIAQTALGGRKGIISRARRATVLADKAAVQYNRYARESETVEEGLATHRRLKMSGDWAKMTPEAQADMVKQVKDARSAMRYQRPIAERAMAAAQEAEKKVSTPMQRVRSQALGVAGIAAGQVLFTATMSAVNKGLGLIGEATGPMFDSMTGFTKTMLMVGDELTKLTSSGGTGAGVAVSTWQAARGLELDLPALERRAGMTAGAVNLESLQQVLRAENAAANRSDRSQGITTGFGNGTFAGVPVLQDLFPWVGQTQGFAERMIGSVGPLTGDITSGEMLPADWMRMKQDWFGPSTPGGNLGTGVAGLLYDITGPLDAIEDFFGEGVNLFERGDKSALMDQWTAPVQKEDTAYELKQAETAGLFFDQMNAGLARVNPKLGKFVTGIESTDEAVEATASAISELENGDELARYIRKFRVSLVDETGEIPAHVKDALDGVLNSDYWDAFEAGLVGMGKKSFKSLWDAYSGVQLPAMVRSLQRQAVYSENVTVPMNFYRSTLDQPIMPAAFGVQPTFGTSTFGGPLSNTSISQKYIDMSAGTLAPVQSNGITIGTSGRPGLIAGLEAARADGRSATIQQLMLARGHTTGVIPSPFSGDSGKATGEYLADLMGVTAQLGEIEVLSKRIENLQIHDTNASLAMQQEQYNEQLRLSTRGLGDALGIAGKLAGTTKSIIDYTEDGQAIWSNQVTAATEYGQLQRAQIMDSRQLSQIQLARSQRELNLNIAISRLRAPGETAAERSVRRQEAEMIAAEQQRELDINKRTTQRGFVIQDIELTRGAEDAMKQFELMTGQRALTIELQGSQSVQTYLTRTKSLKEELLNIPLTLADSLVKGVETAWATFETESGEFKDAFGAEATEMFATLAAEAKKKFKIENILGSWTGTVTFAGTGTAEGPAGAAAPENKGTLSWGEFLDAIGLGKDDDRPMASGGILNASSATSFIAGEAGRESVVVIRNPRAGLVSGGGGGNKNVTININASVRNEGDVDQLVKKVIREIHQQSALVV